MTWCYPCNRGSENRYTQAIPKRGENYKKHLCWYGNACKRGENCTFVHWDYDRYEPQREYLNHRILSVTGIGAWRFVVLRRSIAESLAILISVIRWCNDNHLRSHQTESIMYIVFNKENEIRVSVIMFIMVVRCSHERLRSLSYVIVFRLNV